MPGFVLPAANPLKNKQGWTICHDNYHRREDLAKISDFSESGLVLPNIRSTNGSYLEWQLRPLAHEMGHILLQVGDEHVDPAIYPTNLMTKNSAGDDLTPAQYKIALDYDKAKPDTSYFVVEE